jgi:hypothetical protein
LKSVNSVSREAQISVENLIFLLLFVPFYTIIYGNWKAESSTAVQLSSSPCLEEGGKRELTAYNGHGASGSVIYR